MSLLVEIVAKLNNFCRKKQNIKPVLLIGFLNILGRNYMREKALYIYLYGLNDCKWRGFHVVSLFSKVGDGVLQFCFYDSLGYPFRACFPLIFRQKHDKWFCWLIASFFLSFFHPNKSVSVQYLWPFLCILFSGEKGKNICFTFMLTLSCDLLILKIVE